MKLKSLYIRGYKSIQTLKLSYPNSFTVFVGPNGVGKSNIFEAIEFANFIFKVNVNTDAENLFGGVTSFLNYNNSSKSLTYDLGFSDFSSSFSADYKNIGPVKDYYAFDNYKFGYDSKDYRKYFESKNINYNNEIEQFQESFTRLFIGNDKIRRINSYSEDKLNPDSSNLEKVLKRLLSNNKKKDELFEYLNLFIPGFDKIEILSDIISGVETLLFYEKGYTKAFDKKLISDGTFNILSLLTITLQSDSPQFLCIEEPENGLNPYVIKTLVEFFRKQCEEKGHYIWLNTHSQTLVKHLNPKELILVDKVNGATQIKQFPKGYNLQGLELDEAWLSNALGGGVPW